MAKIEKKLSEKELVDLIIRWKNEKQTRPSRINRPLTYQLYNNFFNQQQRDVNACTCLDRDTDFKVTRHIENNYKNVVKIEEPLPIESNVSVDFSSLTTGKSADDELFDLSDLVEEKPKKTRRKKQA
jgi:hypothetical protein